MANYTTLKSTIEDNIKENGVGAITGPVLQSSLLSMVNSLGVGYQFVGIATTSMNPGTPDQRVFYVASTAGNYANFGSLRVYPGELAILKYDGSWEKISVSLTPNSLYINNVIPGKGQEYSSVLLIGFIPGHKCRVWLKSTSWDLTGVTISSNYNLFQLTNWYNDINTDTLFVVKTDQTPAPYYDFVVPENSDYMFIGGRAAVGTNIYFSIQDLTAFEHVGTTRTLADADVYRKLTGHNDAVNDPNGVRLRIILQVMAGMKVAIFCNDPGGCFCGVWNTRPKAILSRGTESQQLIIPEYKQGYYEAVIENDGYLGASLTNGNVPITDEKQAEMLSHFWIAVGTGESFVAERSQIGVIANADAIDNIENKTALANVYYGDKISLNNSYKIITHATNSRSGQSAAAYGNYLFIVTNYLEYIACYNLRTKSLLYTLETGLTSEDYWHCNQSSFGKHFYDDEDMFPLLYISQRNDENGQCSAMGFRIIPVISEDTGEIESFTISLIQTIKFPVMTDENCLGNVNATFDLQEDWLWGYSRNNNSEAANFNKARFTKFAIPALRDENEGIIPVVNLTDADIIEAFYDDWSMLNAQGAFIQNGKLVIGQGYPSAGYINVRVVDLYAQKKQTSLIDLYKNGFKFEPEGMVFWDNRIVMHTSSTRIFIIDVL